MRNLPDGVVNAPATKLDVHLPVTCQYGCECSCCRGELDWINTPHLPLLYLDLTVLAVHLPHTYHNLISASPSPHLSLLLLLSSSKLIMSYNDDNVSAADFTGLEAVISYFHSNVPADMEAMTAVTV